MCVFAHFGHWELRIYKQTFSLYRMYRKYVFCLYDCVHVIFCGCDVTNIISKWDTLCSDEIFLRLNIRYIICCYGSVSCSSEWSTASRGLDSIYATRRNSCSWTVPFPSREGGKTASGFVPILSSLISSLETKFKP